MSTYREYVKTLLDRRLQALKDRADFIYARHGKRLDNEKPGARSNREFLEKHAVGVGVDVCCGDFLIEGAVGVDSAQAALGADYHCRGDDLAFSKANELDYVVTNYLEALPSTLKALNEWYRCLKAGGTLALVCMDADSYTNREGAMQNRSRLHTFSKVTIAQYLSRAGFSGIEVETTSWHSLHVTARKTE